MTPVILGTARHRTDIENMKENSIDGQWLTTPWPHIEAAMAYQIGLPVLILREAGVIAEGVLEKGVLGLYLPSFDLQKDVDHYLNSMEWGDVFAKWEHRVRAVVESKGHPPQLW